MKNIGTLSGATHHSKWIYPALQMVLANWFDYSSSLDYHFGLF